MAVKMKEAKAWLNTIRQAAKDKDFEFSKWFLVEAHAISCFCRYFSEKKIVYLLTSPDTSPVVRTNTAVSAKPDSYVVHVRDPDPNIPDDRRACQITTLFTAFQGIKVPLVISAWREGSPNPKRSDTPECLENPQAPPCLGQNRRPVGRIE